MITQDSYLSETVYYSAAQAILKQKGETANDAIEDLAEFLYNSSSNACIRYVSEGLFGIVITSCDDQMPKNDITFCYRTALEEVIERTLLQGVDYSLSCIDEMIINEMLRRVENYTVEVVLKALLFCKDYCLPSILTDCETVAELFVPDWFSAITNNNAVDELIDQLMDSFLR